MSEIKKKAAKGEASLMDLFILIDYEEGDKNGYLNRQEFKILTTRLKMSLTDQKIDEVFTHVKKEKITRPGSDELNQEEF